MFERRSIFGLIFFLIVCASVWRITVLPEIPISMILSNTSSSSQYQEVLQHRQQYRHYYYQEQKQLNRILMDKSKLDFSKLVDLNNFEFLINQPNCRSNGGNETLLSIILIHSAPDNYLKRMVIRSTWGSLNSTRFRLYFLLAKIDDSSKTLQKMIENENKIFSDIIQGNFIDAYRNMTYKHVMAFKWFIYNCPNAKYLLKTDDDVFVNTPYLLDYLENHASRNNLLFCKKEKNARVGRSYRSKWRVSVQEYKGSYYPPYCPGFAILYSSDVVFRLYQEAQSNPYFWIDDVHITGKFAQKANIPITSFIPFLLTKRMCDEILESSSIDHADLMFLVSDPNVYMYNFPKLWAKIQDIVR